jgi:hypothetical protein
MFVFQHGLKELGLTQHLFIGPFFGITRKKLFTVNWEAMFLTL